SGSAGVDVALARTISITNGEVQVVETTAKGPLGHGLSALLIGRSSISRQGIFVLPGLIDADYHGIIKVMIKVFAPPVTIPQGSKIAQLIPFKGQAPVRASTDRGEKGFGSTGNNLVLFTKRIGPTRPKRKVVIRQRQASLQEEMSLSQITMMMDTGSDITICP
ncbi:POK9 protein, partial [Dromaius novaehollandiae]|nr:POK9 protein [Dromaius novaehollandiae]